MEFRAVCLDLDDTLVPNTHKYFVPNLQCAAIVAKELGRHGLQPMKLLEMRTKIDVEMVGEKGFSLDRVPRSWVLTYERLCKRVNLAMRPEIVEELMAAGARFAEGPFEPLPGVPEMLRNLAEKVPRICLVTAGDEGLQWRKIEESGLRSLFHEIHVTILDKKPFLSSVAGNRPGETVMVGDSMKSDISPAVDLGMVAVHVPNETWAYANADIDSSRYHRLEDVTRLPEFLSALQKAAS